MHRLTATAAVSSLFFIAAPAFALTPGLYEYAVKMSMPGMTADAGSKTVQRCLTASDVEGNKAIEIPPMQDSDCKINDQVITGTQFSYRISCTKPQKLEGEVKGTVTATNMTMDMNMRMPELPGAITQNITARRIGDCK